MTEQAPKPAPTDKKAWYHEALEIFSRLSGWVLVPLIAGVTIGRWLDRRYESAPKWFLVSIGIAFVISTIGLVRQAKAEYKKMTPPQQ